MLSEQRQHQDDNSEAFQDLIGNLLMTTEELRRHVLTTSDVTSETCLHWRHEMEGIMNNLHHPILRRASNDDVQIDLSRHVRQRVKAAFRIVLDGAVRKTERTPEEVMDAAVWAVFQEGYKRIWCRC